SAADAQMKFLGDFLRGADPYFLSDSLSQAPRPLSAHQHTQRTFLGFKLDDTPLHPTWFSHAIIQYGPRNSVTSMGDEWGNSGSLNNYGYKLPVVNDEYGYIDNSVYRLKDGTTFTETRTVLRNALWGIITGGGFGTFGGDTTPVGACSSGAIFCGNWLDQPGYYGDVKVMVDFISALPFWQMAPANNRATGARAYGWGKAGNFVIYVAAGGTVTFNGSSPTLCNVVRLDPRTGSAKSLGIKTVSFQLVSPDSQDYVYHLTGPRCD